MLSVCAVISCESMGFGEFIASEKLRATDASCRSRARLSCQGLIGNQGSTGSRTKGDGRSSEQLSEIFYAKAKAHGLALNGEQLVASKRITWSTTGTWEHNMGRLRKHDAWGK